MRVKKIISLFFINHIGHNRKHKGALIQDIVEISRKAHPAAMRHNAQITQYAV